ncbi:hypothetical protein AB0M34_33130 [Nocardia sp. NPDC050193]
MSDVTAAALFCEATGGLAAKVKRWGSTHGQRVRAMAATARDHAAEMVRQGDAEALSLQRTELFSPDDTTIWLSGRVWRPQGDGESMRDWLTSMPRMRFRPDQVERHLLGDADGVPASLAYPFTDGDFVHWRAEAEAVDRRLQQEYEIGTLDDIRDFPGLEGRSRYVDRAHTNVVPGPWYHPEEPGKRAWTVSNHKFRAQSKAVIRVQDKKPSGEPVLTTLIIGGREFGELLVTDPDFWRLVYINGGDGIFTSCYIAKPGNNFAKMSIDTARSYDLNTPVHASTGFTWWQASDDGGMLSARPREGATDLPWLEWDRRPPRSSMVVLDGEFVTFHPPSAPRGTLRP